MVVLELDNYAGDGLGVPGSEANTLYTISPAPSRVAPAMAVCARVACYDLELPQIPAKRRRLKHSPYC